MLESVGEECGVVGAVSADGMRSAVADVRTMLPAVEHRGGVAAGLAFPEGKSFRVVKGNGRVEKVLTPDRIDGLAARAALGHTRYATAGPEDSSLAQPEQHTSRRPGERFVFGWNGNLANAEELRREEVRRGTTLRTTGDTELLKLLLLRALQRHSRADLAGVFGEVEAQADGAFNIALLTPDGTLAAYRDYHGIHPLHYAVPDDGGVLVASEDSAITAAAPDVKTSPLQPGELLIAQGSALTLQQVTEPDPARCFFEWVYFSNWQSHFDGLSVGSARHASGRILALLDTIAPAGSSVVAVPDSARRAAEAYAQQKKWPLIEGGLVNRLPGQRTFTASDPARTQKAQRKYGINRGVLAGKTIVLVDDSLVRGTTMRELIRRLRTEGGVTQIHLRLACPPILSPCYYGIDFPEIRELIARHNFNGTLRSGTLPAEVLHLIAARLGVDSVQFLPVEAIPLAIGCEIKSLCMACVTGRYPTPCGTERSHVAEGHLLPVIR